MAATRAQAKLRDYFVPECADSIYQEVVRFPQYHRAGRAIDENFVEFDTLRREAESRWAREQDF